MSKGGKISISDHIIDSSSGKLNFSTYRVRRGDHILHIGNEAAVGQLGRWYSRLVGPRRSGRHLRRRYTLQLHSAPHLVDKEIHVRGPLKEEDAEIPGSNGVFQVDGVAGVRHVAADNERLVDLALEPIPVVAQPQQGLEE